MPDESRPARDHQEMVAPKVEIGEYGKSAHLEAPAIVPHPADTPISMPVALLGTDVPAAAAPPATTDGSASD